MARRVLTSATIPGVAVIVFGVAMIGWLPANRAPLSLPGAHDLFPLRGQPFVSPSP
jgi:hypothetical protein